METAPLRSRDYLRQRRPDAAIPSGPREVVVIRRTIVQAAPRLAQVRQVQPVESSAAPVLPWRGDIFDAELEVRLRDAVKDLRREVARLGDEAEQWKARAASLEARLAAPPLRSCAPADSALVVSAPHEGALYSVETPEEGNIGFCPEAPEDVLTWEEVLDRRHA